MILRKTKSLIVDDLKPEPKAEEDSDVEADEGDICTPKSEPPTEDDRPLE